MCSVVSAVLLGTSVTVPNPVSVSVFRWYWYFVIPWPWVVSGACQVSVTCWSPGAAPMSLGAEGGVSSSRTLTVAAFGVPSA